MKQKDALTTLSNDAKKQGLRAKDAVAKKAKVKSVTALADGSPIATKKVGGKLFVTFTGELPADSDYVVKVTLK